MAVEHVCICRTELKLKSVMNWTFKFLYSEQKLKTTHKYNHITCIWPNREDKQVKANHVKRCSTSAAFRKTQIEATLIHHYTPSEWFE